jgi:hypothetical protein
VTNRIGLPELMPIEIDTFQTITQLLWGQTRVSAQICLGCQDGHTRECAPPT